MLYKICKRGRRFSLNSRLYFLVTSSSAWCFRNERQPEIFSSRDLDSAAPPSYRRFRTIRLKTKKIHFIPLFRCGLCTGRLTLHVGSVRESVVHDFFQFRVIRSPCYGPSKTTITTCFSRKTNRLLFTVPQLPCTYFVCAMIKLIFVFKGIVDYSLETSSYWRRINQQHHY